MCALRLLYVNCVLGPFSGFTLTVCAEGIANLYIMHIYFKGGYIVSGWYEF